MDEILKWIEEQKGNITMVAIPLMTVFAIIAGICISSSKRGFEENKPWLKNICIGGFIVTFAVTLLALFFPV